MLLLLVLKIMMVTNWLAVVIKFVLWGNAIVGVILAALALINWLGTDRSHEIFQAAADGYRLQPGDHAQIKRYDERSVAFGIHLLLCLVFGLVGWVFAWKYIPIPSEEISVA